jgi:uncharacterized caspase-like protein
VRILACLVCSALSLLAENVPPGKTYALLVGISQYSKLPHDLWLQYPDVDATTFAQFLQSPRGGSIPAAQLKILTNDQATTGALREAFKTFLKTPGKSDTVYILIAGHGTVDAQGAYILTYDSDPNNLSATAVSMAEIHTIVESELKTAGHVVFLADVCRAATIAGQKTTALGGVVEKIGEAPGEMLGLMAARPRELSNEGPQFGGGHGAFTWSVLQGLAGAADTDRDGFVSASELIDYVSTGVPKLTEGKQHPRDFGNMENTTKLADLSKPGIKLP